MTIIQEYQQRCWKHYRTSIGLPEKYNYIYGNPVKVHVPIDVATDGLMIVGAYPTAQFNSIADNQGNIIRDVPVSDHLYPFSNDTYFDGSSVRRVKSGEELEKYILKELEYPRNRCWITDLVKVFLFKKGHIAKYHQLNYFGTQANRKDFDILANIKENLNYLFDEVKLANPKVILLLGEEVTSVVFKVTKSKANEMLQKDLQTLEIKGKNYQVIASAHPGILMRGGAAGEKWKEITKNQLSKIKLLLQQG